MNKAILDGVRIADFTWVWAGPYGTMLLALMGAEVIKIESARRIDSSRQSSLTMGVVFKSLDESPVFNTLNLNKFGVTLDLSQPKGVELAKKIVKLSDVAAENMRPGVMERLGLGYEALKAIKPDIIYLSSSAYGTRGPYRSYTGYAPNFAAFSGVAHLTGYRDGPPTTLTGSTDLRSATTSAFALLAALYYRQRTGKGQYIDLSSTESLSVLVGELLMDYTMNQRVRSRNGNHDDVMVPHNCYRCKGEDKWVSIAVATDEEWEALCRAMGNPDWTKDERFADAYSRWENQEELDKLIGAWTINRTHYEVMDILQKVGVAAMPSFSAAELFNDPHFKERRLTAEVEHPRMGKQIVIGAPWQISDSPPSVRRASPLLGEHNEYVFGELLGMSRQEIARLEEEKVLY